MRRQALGGGGGVRPELPGSHPDDWEQPQFYGRSARSTRAATSSARTQAWREWLFRAARSGAPRSPYPGWYQQARQHLSTRASSRDDGRHGRRARAQPAARRRWTASTTRRSAEASGRTAATRSSTRSTSSRAASARPGPYVIAVGLDGRSARSSSSNALLDETPSRRSTRRSPRRRRSGTSSSSSAAPDPAHRRGIWSRSGREAPRRARQWHERDKDRATTTPRLAPPADVEADRQPDLLHRRDQRPAAERSTRRSSGRAAWAATSAFRTPTKEDRKDIFDLYLGKVAHDPQLDTPARRDEIARITNGYSPAMIDQICSMALTNAHHKGRAYFGWEDLVDAMTVIESGSAVNVKYTRTTPARSRSTRPGTRPRRTSTAPSSSRAGSRSGCAAARSATTSPSRRKSGSARSRARSFGDLIHTVGAMAAEFAFYGENSIGVGGDLEWRDVALRPAMVGAAGMSPLPLDLKGKTFADETEDADARARACSRLEDSASRLTATPAPIPATRGSARYAAQFIGQAFVTAYNLIRVNRDKVENVANAVYRAEGDLRRRPRAAPRRPALRQAGHRLDGRGDLAEDHGLASKDDASRRAQADDGRWSRRARG